MDISLLMVCDIQGETSMVCASDGAFNLALSIIEAKT